MHAFFFIYFIYESLGSLKILDFASWRLKIFASMSNLHVHSTKLAFYTTRWERSFSFSHRKFRFKRRFSSCQDMNHISVCLPLYYCAWLMYYDSTRKMIIISHTLQNSPLQTFLMQRQPHTSIYQNHPRFWILGQKSTLESWDKNETVSSA